MTSRLKASSGHPAPISIIDAEDARIEPFRDIRERDLSRHGRFIGEGGVVLDQLLRSRRFRPVALMILRNRLVNLLPKLEALPAETPIYVVEREVFDRVAGFPVHRGVMALAEAVDDRGAAVETALEEAIADRACVVVACGISNHDNMGAIFRNAAAFGARAVLLDKRSCDPLYRKAIRVSVGTVLTVPFARWGNDRSIAERLHSLGFECLALSPSGREALSGISDIRPRALFLGAEGEGLDQAVIRTCRDVRIEMAPGLDSLNVATSAAIVLHHFLATGRREGC